MPDLSDFTTEELTAIRTGKLDTISTSKLQSLYYQLEREKTASLSPLEHFKARPLGGLQKAETIGKAPNILQRAVSNLKSPRTRPFTVLPVDLALSASGIPPEDMYPLAGQAVGGFLGGRIGRAPWGATAGSTVGEAVRQGVKAGYRGEKYDVGQVALTAPLTLATEGVFRGAGSVFTPFRRSEQINAMGKELGKMKDALDSRSGAASSQEIIASLQEILDKSLSKSGQAARRIRELITELTERTQEKLTPPAKVFDASGKLFSPKIVSEPARASLTGGELINLERNLSDVIHFAKTDQRGLPVSYQAVPRNSQMEELAKVLRKKISSMVDKFAAKEGFPFFGDISRKISQLKGLNAADRSYLLENLSQTGILGGVVGAASGSPLAGFATSGALMAAKKMGKGLYNVVEKTGAGRAATLGTSELLRTLPEISKGKPRHIFRPPLTTENRP